MLKTFFIYSELIYHLQFVHFLLVHCVYICSVAGIYLLYCVVSQLLSVWYLTVSMLYLLLHVGSLATLFMLMEPCLMYFLLQFRSRILIYTAGLFLLVFHNMDSRMVCSGSLCLDIIWIVTLTSSDHGWKLSVQLSLLKCLYFLSVTCLLPYMRMVIYRCFVHYRIQPWSDSDTL